MSVPFDLRLQEARDAIPVSDPSALLFLATVVQHTNNDIDSSHQHHYYLDSRSIMDNAREGSPLRQKLRELFETSTA